MPPGEPKEPRLAPAEASRAIQPLSEADIPLLESLGASGIDEAWLEESNRLIEVGSHNLKEQDNQSWAAVANARQTFWEDMVGWGDPGNDHHEAYEAFKEKWPRRVPLAQSIDTLRYLYNRGIDCSNMVDQNTEI